MRKIIRLTEQDLNEILSNSVKQILRLYESYGSWKEGGYYNILNQMLSQLEWMYPEYIDDNDIEDFESYLQSNEKYFLIDVDVDSEYDDTVGIGDKYSPQRSISAVRGLENIEQLIKDYKGNRNLIPIGLEALNATINNIDIDRITINDNYK